MASYARPQTEEFPCWADETGLIHICESSAPLGNELLIWTLCDREVESGAAFAPSLRDAVTCSKCTAAERVLKRRADSDVRPAAG